MTVARVAREPVWSEALTRPIAARMPARWRGAAVVMIKAIHTMAFFSIATLIASFTWDGIRHRSTRRTAAAGLIAIAESVVYATNNGVCPLTPLAEELGAASGSVTDIYLPDWLSRRVPLFGGSALVAGIAFNAWTWLQRPSTGR